MTRRCDYIFLPFEVVPKRQKIPFGVAVKVRGTLAPPRQQPQKYALRYFFFWTKLPCELLILAQFRHLMLLGRLLTFYVFLLSRSKSLLPLIFSKRFDQGFGIFDGIESLELVGDTLQCEVVASRTISRSLNKCHISLLEKQICLKVSFLKQILWSVRYFDRLHAVSSCQMKSSTRTRR